MSANAIEVRTTGPTGTVWKPATIVDKTVFEITAELEDGTRIKVPRGAGMFRHCIPTRSDPQKLP